MKKKIIVPIVVSGISLVLGGLIYLGISAFPELLEEEEVVIEEEPKCLLYVGTKTYAAESDASNETSNNVVRSNGVSSVVSYDDVEFVTISPSTRINRGSFKVNNNSPKEFSIVEYQPVYADENNNELTISISKHEEPASSSILDNNEVIASSDSYTQNAEISHLDYNYGSTYNENEEITRVETVKTKKARVNRNKTMHSYEALVGTSLLVVGAVDVIAMAAIRRKKHLFR